MPRSLFPTLFFALLLSGCSGGEPQAPGQGQGQHLQPIDVAEVVSADVVDWSHFTSRLEARQEVDIQPRVSGVVDSVEFREGSWVKKGDLLVKLDPRPFAAEVKRLEAQQKAAQVALDKAGMEAGRIDSLVKSNAVSEEEADARRFLQLQRKAELASVDAALTAARLNLEFTSITAPIDGQVSSVFIDPGNTVSANSSVLTRVVNGRQLFAYFDIDERTWNQKFADVSAETGLAVYLQLAGEDGYPHKGSLDFIDNAINPDTGTLRVRALFEDNAAALRPGAFARVRLAPEKVSHSILVPETALGTDLQNRFVLTVDDNNTLQYQVITLGTRIGALRVINSGLKEGQRIAVNGPARVGPGMPVEPRPVEIDTQALEQSPPLTRIDDSSSSLLSVAD